MVVFRYGVQRLFYYAAFHSLYPVYAVAMLSLIVFWLPEKELCARVEVIGALFLALVGEWVVGE